MCAIAWKGRPRNDLYCVMSGRQDVKPYLLMHPLTSTILTAFQNYLLCADRDVKLLFIQVKLTCIVL